MIGRALAVAGVCACFGAFGLLRPALTGYERPNEAWLETVTPSQVEGVHFIPSIDNPKQSYKMDEGTYKSLKPYGIVSRIFEVQGRRIDAVVIAGDNADSFHDQRACFASQGWTINNEREVIIDVPGRGKVPMVEIDVSHESQGRSTALFAFRGPSGRVFSRFDDMWRDYFWAELSSGRIHGGQFFRFIDLDGSADVEPLHRFAGAYMGQAMDMFDKGKPGQLASAAKP